jgi:F-type H+-transporting ATPase subunit a
MFADHQVIVIWLGLMPGLVPAVFMGLGMLVCFLQAFVFALLTMIYIGQALEEPH